jgi:predicted transcriptional regulator
MTINRLGCFFDQQKVSDITINDLQINNKSRIRFRLCVPQGAPESRGLTVFGRGFGNYDNGIVVRVSYEECGEN